MLNEHVWWYLSRASGLVAGVALAGSCVLGVLLATRVLKPLDRPAWLLAVHRHFAMLFVALTAVHLGGLVADGYVHFGWREVVVPMASAWKPGAVAVGIVALYMAAVVQVSSLLMRYIPRAVWRGIHTMSYITFALVVWHAFWAGSDTGKVFFYVGASIVLSISGAAVGVRLLHMRGPQERVPNRGAGAR